MELTLLRQHRKKAPYRHYLISQLRLQFAVCSLQFAVLVFPMGYGVGDYEWWEYAIM